jgi:sn-glycerol 3-phosphate transport system substrate-binding protein
MLRKGLLVAGLASALSFTAQATQEITWWHAMNGQLGDVVNHMANEFNASQSDYKVIPVYKGTYEETMTSGIAAVRAGQSPNVIQIFDAGAATIMSAKGIATPVYQIMKESGADFDKNDFIEGVRNFYADSQGEMVGMPFNSSTPVLYYNKDALAKAGVEVPQTWEEMEAIAPKLKAAGYIAFAQSHSTWIFSENFHARHNLQLADKNNGFDGLSTNIKYNNPSMRMMWSKLKEWSDKGWYKYYGVAWGDNQQAFERQETAMWLGSSGSFGGLLNKADFKFGTSYLPYWKSVNDKPGATFIGGAALFALSGHSKSQDQGVAAFFSYLTKPETQYYWHKETGYVPITKAAYGLAKKEGHYLRFPDAEMGIKQLSLPVGQWARGYRLGNYVQIRDVMNREYAKILAGDVSVEKAFKTIEADSNKLLARFARTVK